MRALGKYKHTGMRALDDTLQISAALAAISGQDGPDLECAHLAAMRAYAHWHPNARIEKI